MAEINIAPKILTQEMLDDLTTRARSPFFSHDDVDEWVDKHGLSEDIRIRAHLEVTRKFRYGLYERKI
jgi:hypothetical protein